MKGWSSAQTPPLCGRARKCQCDEWRGREFESLRQHQFFGRSCRAIVPAFARENTNRQWHLNLRSHHRKSSSVLTLFLPSVVLRTGPGTIQTLAWRSHHRKSSSVLTLFLPSVGLRTGPGTIQTLAWRSHHRTRAPCAEFEQAATAVSRYGNCGIHSAGCRHPRMCVPDKLFKDNVYATGRGAQKLGSPERLSAKAKNRSEITNDPLRCSDPSEARATARNSREAKQTSHRTLNHL